MLVFATRVNSTESLVGAALNGESAVVIRCSLLKLRVS